MCSISPVACAKSCWMKTSAGILFGEASSNWRGLVGSRPPNRSWQFTAKRPAPRADSAGPFGAQSVSHERLPAPALHFLVSGLVPTGPDDSRNPAQSGTNGWRPAARHGPPLPRTAPRHRVRSAPDAFCAPRTGPVIPDRRLQAAAPTVYLRPAAPPPDPPPPPGAGSLTQIAQNGSP